MRKLPIGALVAGAAAIAVTLAPQAHAYTEDETQYLQALKAASINVNASNAAGIVDWGYRICGDLRNGVNPWAIARNTVLNGGATNLGVARTQVDIATVWLCPDEITRIADSGV